MKSDRVYPFSNKNSVSQTQEFKKEAYSRLETANSPRSEVAKFSVTLSKKEMMIEKDKTEASFNRYVESKIRFENEILPTRSRGHFNPQINPKKPETFKPSVKVFPQPPASLTGPEQVAKRLRSPPNHNEVKRNPIIEGEPERPMSPKAKFEISKQTILLNEKKMIGAHRFDSPKKINTDSYAYKMRHKATTIDWASQQHEPIPKETAHRKIHPSNQFGKDMKSILQYEFHTPRASLADIRSSVQTSPKTEFKETRLKTLC
jgi:hypothetical protein